MSFQKYSQDQTGDLHDDGVLGVFPRVLPSIATTTRRSTSPGQQVKFRTKKEELPPASKYDPKLFSRKKIELPPLSYENVTLQTTGTAHLPVEIANFVNRVRNVSLDGSDSHTRHSLSESSEVSTGRHKLPLTRRGGGGGVEDVSLADETTVRQLGQVPGGPLSSTNQPEDGRRQFESYSLPTVATVHVSQQLSGGKGAESVDATYLAESAGNLAESAVNQNATYIAESAVNQNATYLAESAGNQIATYLAESAGNGNGTHLPNSLLDLDPNPAAKGALLTQDSGSMPPDGRRPTELHHEYYDTSSDNQPLHPSAGRELKRQGGDVRLDARVARDSHRSAAEKSLGLPTAKPQGKAFSLPRGQVGDFHRHYPQTGESFSSSHDSSPSTSQAQSDLVAPVYPRHTQEQERGRLLDERSSYRGSKERQWSGRGVTEGQGRRVDGKEDWSVRRVADQARRRDNREIADSQHGDREQAQHQVGRKAMVWFRID